MNRRDQIAPYYPIFLNISGKKCVVVGGGPVALRKVRSLLEHGARVQVLSPDPCPELSRLARRGTVDVLRKGYEPGDLGGAVIVVAATDNGKTNGEVADEAKQRGILVNVVDDPQRSDFIVPSYLRRGDVTIAVSTGGRSPALARKIRSKLEGEFGAEYATLAVLASEVRSELRRRGITVNTDDWQNVLDLGSLTKMVRESRGQEAREILLNSLEELGRREA